jgi:YD repeat-containing protein
MKFSGTIALIICSICLIFSSCNTVSVQKINTFYSNGNKKEKGKLKNGKKVGHWFIYTDTGWMEKREKWIDGNWIWTITYNEKHEKIEWADNKGNRKSFKPCGCSH